MQIYALDKNNVPTHAQRAKKQLDYRCPECAGVVRVRGGNQRQAHFYHLSLPENCRQNGKTLEHLQIQLHLFDILSSPVTLERRFPSINRIADVVWEDKKLIFEVQCSPITTQEIQARQADYAREGYQVIWILHDSRYNRQTVTAAEDFLKCNSYYFSNMNEKGEGEIYDQLEIIQKGRRIMKSFPMPINPTFLQETDSYNVLEDTLPYEVQMRLENRRFYFVGDFLDLYQSETDCVTKLSAFLNRPIKESQSQSLLGSLKNRFSHSYQVLFHALLDKCCH